LLNTTFYLKMALLVCALVLTGALQWSLSSTPQFWEQNRGRRVMARLAATLSILLWSSVLFAGRFIAYTQVG
jgi:hypothetical protein